MKVPAVCVFLLLVLLHGSPAACSALRAQADASLMPHPETGAPSHGLEADADLMPRPEIGARSHGLEVPLRRSKRFNSHFPICSYCCNCCHNKGCGFCCRT
ncbi:hepcidin [Alligator mississippiensis]|uniref:Hepcidin n=1 Tax=Alligator mississippiensis TaxID=8496 RepID=A0A151MVQ2_ALLMI|nr:hepcidin [Alligator mississippiensis]KYO28626.1 hepcidin [Alligator mississippiensis]